MLCNIFALLDQSPKTDNRRMEKKVTSWNSNLNDMKTLTPLSLPHPPPEPSLPVSPPFPISHLSLDRSPWRQLLAAATSGGAPYHLPLLPRFLSLATGKMAVDRM